MWSELTCLSAYKNYADSYWILPPVTLALALVLAVSNMPGKLARGR